MTFELQWRVGIMLTIPRPNAMADGLNISFRPGSICRPPGLRLLPAILATYTTEVQAATNHQVIVEKVAGSGNRLYRGPVKVFGQEPLLPVPSKCPNGWPRLILSSNAQVTRDMCSVWSEPFLLPLSAGHCIHAAAQGRKHFGVC